VTGIAQHAGTGDQRARLGLAGERAHLVVAQAAVRIGLQESSRCLRHLLSWLRTETNRNFNRITPPGKTQGRVWGGSAGA
jgi:hypothetical protein